MEPRKLTISIDGSILDSADAVLDDIGLDMQTAIRMFLKKLITERKMPFELSASQPLPESQLSPPPPITKGNTPITPKMRDAVWDEFKRRHSGDSRDFKGAAQLVRNETGMNSGSAFIYFTILNNLVNGRQSKRSMAFKDLEFFVNRIKAEFPEDSLKSAIASLKASIPYWDEKVPGVFADKVRSLVRQLENFEPAAPR